MSMSPGGQKKLKGFEGLRLKAYPDPATGGEPWTIGYGHTGGVKKGDVCTQEQAEDWFQEDVAEAEGHVDREVKVPLTQGMRDATISLVFNIGPGSPHKDGILRLKNGQPSTFLRKLNALDFEGAADQITRWVFGGGKVIPGLQDRRQVEKEMFEADSDPASILEPVQEAPSSPQEQGFEPPPPPTPFYSEPGPQDWPETQPPARSPSMNWSNAGTVATTAAAFLNPALGAVLSAAPALIKMFGGESKVTERNATAVQLVVDTVKTAIGAKNEQEVVERLQDKATAQVARQAIEENYFQIHQAIEQSRQSARDYAITSAQAQGVRTVFYNFTFVEFLTLVFLGSCWAAIGLVTTFGKISQATLDNIILLAAVASIVGIREFWYGSSFGSRQKDVAAERQAPPTRF